MLVSAIPNLWYQIVGVTNISWRTNFYVNSTFKHIRPLWLADTRRIVQPSGIPIKSTRMWGIVRDQVSGQLYSPKVHTPPQ